jgi:predicted RNase H-like nuclease (RuvC/YqgF family)
MLKTAKQEQMEREKRLNEMAGQCGEATSKPYNQVESLQRENESLKYQIQEQKEEILNLYRRVNQY